MKKWLKFILVPAGFVIFIIAITLLNDQLKSLSYDDISTALDGIPSLKIALAMLLALLYYILLGGYDILAYKYIKPNVPLKTKDIAFTCFVSNVLGNNTGYSMLFGGSLRYRLYSIHNVSMIAVTKVLFFSSATIWLGLLTVGGVLFTLFPVSIGFWGYEVSSRIVGITFLTILFAYILLCTLNIENLYFFKRKITLPKLKIAAWQVLLASADWIIASLTLWTLMPTGDIPYFVLLKVFLVSQLLGILSQVPGGMGVFEASITLMLPNLAANPEVFSALLIYRVVFYFFPLSVALIMLASYEAAAFFKRLDAKTKLIGKAVSSVIVQMLGILLFFAGMFAIFLTAAPTETDRFRDFFSFIPQIVRDISHFALSLIAAGLLFISRAVQLRIKSAYKAACILLGISIIIFISSGKYIPIIIYFVLLLIVLINSKNYFYRTRSILTIPFGTWWYCAISAVLVLSLWLGFFVNKEAIFTWVNWDVFFDVLINDENDSRYARAAIGVMIVFGLVIFQRFFGKRQSELPRPKTAEIEKIIDGQSSAFVLAAVKADEKSFIVDKKKKAFIIYGHSQNYNIAIGDPVGSSGGKGEMLWSLKEMCDRNNEMLSFIAVGDKYIRYYKDIGLNIISIGKEAKINLSKFDGAAFKNIKTSVESSGVSYEIVKAADFEKFRETFRTISAKWEKDKEYISRHFIPGNYDEDKMSKNDYGVLRKNGEIFAFAVLEETKDKQEITSPIVRLSGGSEEDFVYLIYKNVCYGKENGFLRFDLGLAYFEAAGIIKTFAQMFSLAEHFAYNLDNLRLFKDMFNPEWSNKFAAIFVDSFLGVRTYTKTLASLIFPSQKESRLRFRLIRRFFQR
ncbi:MAG: phosphatidylglycerol lysyltransferase domain-containing protein [Elusimicrobiota bacterium]|jgi:phosphatidylglycerol lysyltransferase|nr:phosphatidylglycerol lysyltransferase domain-containing protein [Elusimicrobiota bacterium]